MFHFSLGLFETFLHYICTQGVMLVIQAEMYLDL
jgi:hypothetical protein